MSFFDKDTRILQVLPALNTGGVERGTLEVASAIQQAGGSAYVASSGGWLLESLTRTGAKHTVLPLHSKNPIKILLNVNELVKYIQRYKINLVHARSRAPAWSAYLACQRTNTPFVTTYHGLYSGNSRLKKWYNGVMIKGDRVIAISRFIQQELERQYPQLDQRKVTTIPRGVDLAIFNPDEDTAKQQHSLLQRWDLQPDIPVIMIPGRLSPWKGQTLAIQALATLQDIPWQAVFVGGGNSKLENTHRQLATELGIVDRLHWAGDVSMMSAAYALSSIVVCPSTRPEAFGRTVIEAQAMGRVVIASDHGGAAETIINNETGILVEPGNEHALGGAMRQGLTMDNATKQQLQKAACIYARQTYPKEVMLQAILNVYQELLAGV